MHDHDLMKEIMLKQLYVIKSRWYKKVKECMEMMKLNIATIEKIDKKEISKRTMQWDTQQWLK